MANFKFELNPAGVVELLKSSKMEAALLEQGRSVASAAGKGYSYRSVSSGDRKKVFVSANTKEANRDNLKHNTLLKALGGSK